MIRAAKTVMGFVLGVALALSGLIVLILFSLYVIGSLGSLFGVWR